MDVTLFLKMFAALFAIMTPVANLPVFLSLAGDRSAAEQRRIALTVIVALVVGAAVIAAGGTLLLRLFGISVDAFRLAGGFLILLIALTMVSGRQSATHQGTEAEQAHHASRDSPAIYPLTVPILLGPGTISTMVIYRPQVTGLAEAIAYGLAVAAAIALVGGAFLAAPRLDRMLGQTAISILNRVMGMILAAIAMQMMADSLANLLPGLKAAG